MIVDQQQSLLQWLQTDAPVSARQAAAGKTYRAARSIIANPAALVGLIIILLLIAVAFLAPQLARGISPISQDLNNRLHAPDVMHWFGPTAALETPRQ